MNALMEDDLLRQSQVQRRVNLQTQLGVHLDVSALPTSLQSAGGKQQVAFGKVKHPVFHQVATPFLAPGSSRGVKIQGSSCTTTLFRLFRPTEPFASTHTEHGIVIFFDHQTMSLGQELCNNQTRFWIVEEDSALVLGLGIGRFLALKIPRKFSEEIKT